MGDKTININKINFIDTLSIYAIKENGSKITMTKMINKINQYQSYYPNLLMSYKIMKKKVTYKIPLTLN